MVFASNIYSSPATYFNIDKFWQDSNDSVAAYLTDILEANDSALLASALGDIARARGMSEIAKASGRTREALYKALRPNAKPRYETIAKVCGALVVRLVARAIHA
ncbi:MAG: addiction module antidote protein [Sulfuricella sp.]